MKNLLFDLVQRKAVVCKFGPLLLSRMKAKDVVFVLCLMYLVFHPLSSSAQVPVYVPTSGLVGWWPFNGNANDESGNGNNGTVNGATLTTDRFGVANKAYSFNGSNLVSNYITLNNPLTTSTSFSFSYWLQRSVTTNAKWHFMVLGTNANHELLFNLDTLIYRNYNNSNGNYFDVKTYVPNNLQYSHLCITTNGTQTTLFVNGIQVGSGMQNIVAAGSGTLHFGKHSTFAVNTATAFNGKMDDIAIYNRALNQQEINNLYTSSLAPFVTTSASPTFINCGESSTITASSTSTVQPCMKADLPTTLQNGLVGYWPFCGNANDASGNGNNGTVNGAVLTSDRNGNSNSAFDFNGTTSHISLNNSICNFGVSDFTISTWVYKYDLLNGSVVGKRNSPSDGNMLILASGPSYEISTGTGDFTYGMSVPEYTNLNSWYHITLVRSGNNLKTYTNGLLVDNTITSTIHNINNSAITEIGARYNGSLIWNLWHGKIDDIAIYNRSLTPTEIQQLYSLGNVSYSWSTGATTPSITVTPAQTTSYTCTATNSAGSTTSSVSVTVADTLTWTGALDTDWHKPCNWSPQFVPKCCNNVSVPLTTNQPIVSGVAAAEDLTIYTTNGAQITVNNGANLQIADCPTTIITTACPSLAVISTTAVSSITQTTAVSGGTIAYQGASAITARGICWSTSINPTIANSTTSNGTGVGTFTSNLTGLVAGTTYYVRTYATNGSGTSYGNQVSFVAINPQPAYPANSVFCASGPTLVVDVTNPTTGKTWMDRNLGATQVATSSTDAAAYGDLYQWGRGNDGHQCRTSSTTTTLSATDQPGHGNFITVTSGLMDWRSPQNPNLWQGVNGVNNPCPNGYRVPTEVEWENETINWISSISIDGFPSNLKIPEAGFRSNATGLLTDVGTFGYLWCSTLFAHKATHLYFFSNVPFLITSERVFGLSIRCIKN
jgi:hypothetical protein